MPKPSPITYFEEEGSGNLQSVIKVLKRTLEKRPELRSCKIVFLTVEGRGPALAYTALQNFEPKIIAVTFAPRACAKVNGQSYIPEISERVRKFFEGVEIPLLRARLPFDPFGSRLAHQDSKAKLVADTLALLGGSFQLAVQAVLQACDMGFVDLGESVISVTGDCALLVAASSTDLFLTPTQGMAVLEIFCKPRNLTITRPSQSPDSLILDASHQINESQVLLEGPSAQMIKE